MNWKYQGLPVGITVALLLLVIIYPPPPTKQLNIIGPETIRYASPAEVKAEQERRAAQAKAEQERRIALLNGPPEIGLLPPEGTDTGCWFYPPHQKQNDFSEYLYYDAPYKVSMFINGFEEAFSDVTKSNDKKLLWRLKNEYYDVTVTGKMVMIKNNTEIGMCEEFTTFPEGVTITVSHGKYKSSVKAAGNCGC